MCSLRGPVDRVRLYWSQTTSLCVWSTKKYVLQILSSLSCWYFIWYQEKHFKNKIKHLLFKMLKLHLFIFIFTMEYVTAKWTVKGVTYNNNEEEKNTRAFPFSCIEHCIIVKGVQFCLCGLNEYCYWMIDFQMNNDPLMLLCAGFKTNKFCFIHCQSVAAANQSLENP